MHESCYTTSRKLWNVSLLFIAISMFRTRELNVPADLINSDESNVCCISLVKEYWQPIKSVIFSQVISYLNSKEPPDQMKYRFNEGALVCLFSS